MKTQTLTSRLDAILTGAQIQRQLVKRRRIDREGWKFDLFANRTYIYCRTDQVRSIEAALVKSNIAFKPGEPSSPEQSDLGWSIEIIT